MRCKKYVGRSIVALAAGATFGLCLPAIQANAAEISVHFQNGSNGTVDASGAAGAPGAAQTGDWNNEALTLTDSTVYGSAGGTASNSLINNSAAKTTLNYTISDINPSSGYESDGLMNQSQTSSSAGTENKELWSSGENGSMWASYESTVYSRYGLQIVMSNIPYSQYDVYVYVGGSTTGSVSDGTTTYYFSPAYSPFPGYESISSQSSASPTTGNYAVFSDTTSSLTLTLSAPSTLPFGPSSTGAVGFQIVQTPEPMSIGIFGIAGAALLLRRRRSAIDGC